MSIERVWAYVFWIGIAIVTVEILFVQIPRSIREVRRIMRRMKAYGDLPVIHAGEAAAREAVRLAAALDQLPALERRASAAIAALRATPLVPPVFRETMRRVQAEIAAFQVAVRR
ncbi:MAG: hypothetical protein NVSMB64_23090 [Candidatus Velthaea sp.]